jgi:TPR repeat protein
MKPFTSLAFLAIALLSACSQERETTEDNLSQTQIADLEYRASAADVVAIERLRSHYLFRHDFAKAESYFKQALELKHPEAMYEQAMRLADQAKSNQSVAEKRRLLEAAKRITIEVNRREGKEDLRTDITYKYIEKELRKIDSDPK